ncbi:hypothetical protein Tco_0289422 [Tanacetum coccineum]
MSRPTGLKRLKKVGMSRRVESSEDQESLVAPEDASKHGRSIADIDADVEVTLVDETQERQDDELMFDTKVFDADEMHVEEKVDEKDEQSTKLNDSTAGKAIKVAKPKVVTTAATTTTTTRPKAKGVVVQEPSEFRVPQEAQPLISKDKGKEREELTDEEKGKLFMELIKKRRKYFAALRHKKRETDLLLRHKRELKCLPILSTWESKEKKVEGSKEIAKGNRKKMLGRKRAEKEQQQESSKKQRIEEDKGSDEVEEVSEDGEGELIKHLVIKKDKDIAIDAIPLATKLSVIIDYKLHKEGMLVHYQLIRADGSFKRHSSMIRMLQGIDREDLEALWKIVKTKYSDIRPKDEFKRVLWGDLKVMFEPDKRSDVWRILQGYRVTIWKLINSSGVHFVRRNLKIQKMNIKFRGGLLGLKRLHGFLEVTTAQKPHIFYNDDDDDDEESSIPLRDLISELPLSVAITPDLPITDSLIMEDEHRNTIPETESDEVIKSSVENLFPIPSDFEVLSKDLSDIESECDIPVCDDLTTFYNPLFDSNDDFTSSDDESLYDEDVPEENFKIYSNPLFDEEIISTKLDLHHFNTQSNLIESLLNRDTSIVSSPKFDSLLEEFFGELAHINLIPPGIDETDFDPEEDICLTEKSLYDNSSPRPPKKLNSENSDAIIESLSPSPIPIEDKLLSNDSLSLPENESFHFDHYYDPSSPRPPAKPPEDDGIHFDIEPDTGFLTAKVVDDISEHYVLMPSILPTRCPMIDTLFPFSSENENKVFNSGILASNEEKSPHLLSHRGFKAFQIISNFSNSPMMIYGGDSPILDVSFLHFYPP